MLGSVFTTKYNKKLNFMEGQGNASRSRKPN